MINMNEILIAITMFAQPEFSKQTSDIASAECAECGGTLIFFPGGTIVCTGDCDTIINLITEPFQMTEPMNIPIILDIQPDGGFEVVPAVNYSIQIGR